MNNPQPGLLRRRRRRRHTILARVSRHAMMARHMTTSAMTTLFVTLALGAGLPAAWAQEADASLDAFFKEYLEDHFRLRPLEATRLGDHRFDAMLDDLSRKARDGWVAHARQTLAQLHKQVNYAKLSRDGQIDFELFKHELATTLWLAENTHPFEDDPRVYNGYVNDSTFLLLTQSTLPKETNVANC